MDLRQIPHRTLGSLQPAREAAALRRTVLPDHLVVGSRESRQKREQVLRSPSGGTLTRRAALIGAGAATTALLPFPTVRANDLREVHGLSAFGDLKYPADFRHFDYVNPSAPKGGLFSQI